MAKYRKKYINRKHNYLRFNRTGEDIDILNERKYENEKSGAFSSAYKDNIDGA